MWQLEQKLWNSEYRYIAGVDEAGRGSLSGPVIAAVFVADRDQQPSEVMDSKLLSDKRRRQLYSDIISVAVDYAIGLATAEEVDKLNVLEATMLAMKRAVNGLRSRPDIVLIDGNAEPEWDYSSSAIIKGDNTVGSIAAASILAKVARDTLMNSYHLYYPKYCFRSNKGYGTVEHLKALKKNGPCPLHRSTFRGVRQPTILG